jgi:dienelactone hydrolase
MKKILVSCLAWLLAFSAQAAVQTQEIEYQVDGQSFTGYLAWNDAFDEARPGVLVVHEWWGHNNYVRMRAEMLANLGYVALALDMYGTGKLADHPAQATEFMQAVISDMPQAEKRFNTALALLRDNAAVDASRIAAIGYCFGGGTVLHMARQGTDLKGVVSFHGALGTQIPAQKGKVKSEVLVLNGEADPMVPPQQVEAFQQEMAAADVAFRVVNYPGAKHGFTNPEADAKGKAFDMPLAYDAKADQASWREMRVFLERVFAK